MVLSTTEPHAPASRCGKVAQLLGTYRSMLMEVVLATRSYFRPWVLKKLGAGVWKSAAQMLSSSVFFVPSGAVAGDENRHGR